VEDLASGAGPMRVVAFTGMPGSGKSEAVAEAKRRGLPIVSMGDFVREAVRSQGLAGTDENLGRIATQMRRDHGADYWAQRTCDRVMDTYQDAPLVIIDGVRTLAEIEVFRRRLGTSFHLVAITVPDAVRAERLTKRQRSDDPADAKLIAQRDQREIGWGILQAIASADTVIDNSPPLSEFRRHVAGLFDQLTSAA
jgi:dephospho-CoA kinase